MVEHWQQVTPAAILRGHGFKIQVYLEIAFLPESSEGCSAAEQLEPQASLREGGRHCILTARATTAESKMHGTAAILVSDPWKVSSLVYSYLKEWDGEKLFVHPSGHSLRTECLVDILQSNQNERANIIPKELRDLLKQLGTYL
ncbi:uncharacterized protein LOC110436889 isoform X1 [Sorghum bicolor]|uniref:uncharacterized protein LOC110436889 isoform X1 n=1 Tax=Sorghum bicolor TaxID=4558 RepID=UPI000B42655B|nr:uncharacterized protein LOC110436889 isoform X1 [Sorghum bicolor]|eukprot:XP_021320222.1 uncharacterized protein LOC110436889 isoform X1 [Sorghum bicolor]